MSSRTSVLRVGFVVTGLALVASAWAQNALPADTQPSAPEDASLLLTRAVLQYNRAGTAPERSESISQYLASIADLSTVLKLQPQMFSARFLKALAHGQLALRYEEAGRQARVAKQPQVTQKAVEDAIEQYDRMAAELDALLKATPSEEYAIVRLLQGVDHLLNGVAQAKLARYEPQRRIKFLHQARESLESYLQPKSDSGREEPSGLNRVRAEFFLGVVLYRLSLKPGKGEDAPDEVGDPVMLDSAGKQISKLIDPQSPEQVAKLLPAGMPQRDEEVDRWSSYPTLYLGLIRMRQGNLAAMRRQLDEARNLYVEARGFFEQSKQFDDFQGRSLSDDAIPRVSSTNLEEIGKALRQLDEPVDREFNEDLVIEWRTGFAYDTNVILLGHDTSPPPDIGRRRDVWASTGIGLGYTLDLGKVDPKLERWSVGLLGRAFANWHGDVDEYNEQLYGGSAAVQYELLEQNQQGSRNGPLYFGLQYDYDYFLLGNDGFLKVNRLNPRLTLYTLDQRLQTTLAMRYEDRNYLERLYDNDFDRDGNYFAFSAAQSADLMNMTEAYGAKAWGLANDPQEGDDDFDRYLRPYIGYEYGWDSTRGREFDNAHNLLAAGVFVPLPYGLQFDFGGEWEWQDYNGHSLIDYHRRGREDFIQRYLFGLERRFVLVPGDPKNRGTLAIDRLVLVLRGQIQFTLDDSNVEDRLGQEIFSYDRAIYGLTVGLLFN